MVDGVFALMNKVEKGSLYFDKDSKHLITLSNV